MSKIDTEKFIVDILQQLMEGHPLKVNILLALLKQGLFYTDGSIVRIVNMKKGPSLEEAITNEPVVKRVTQILKESEDERIRKEMLDFFNGFYNNKMPKAVDVSPWIAWLEKQGEHKNFRDSIQVGDKVTRNEDGVLVNLSQLNRVAKKDEQILANSTKTCKDEQKTADKVEPKFKVGDWVVYTGYLLKDSGKEIYVMQVASVEDDRYNFTDTSTLCFDSEKDMRSWTIQDAKAGDVLACPNDAGDRDVVFIFKNINSDEGWVFCFCASDANGCFCTNNDYVGNSNSTSISPATKEQRDLLFQKMREAGYEWDAEKRELKKIEQKPAWSEEDEEMLKMVIKSCEQCGNEYAYYWLKSLKDRVQPKQEWSEEDSIILSRIIADYERSNEEWFNAQKSLPHGKKITWLKSLRPQNRWKPSDEQMVAV